MRIKREAVREELIDRHIEESKSGYARLSVAEAANASNALQITVLAEHVKNLDLNVQTLIASQERTNDELQHLNRSLMDYLRAEAQRRKGTP
jgi:hypothetical protein